MPETAGTRESYNYLGVAKKLVFYVPPQISPFGFYLRAAVYVVLFIWGSKFIFTPMESNYAGRSFLHLVNLPFHEAGHVFFGFFGQFIGSLGGSLGQLLMPLICLFAMFVTTGDTFGASVCLWWFGENFLDIAPYMDDANELTMMLLGGNTGSSSPYGFHDWEYILTEAGLYRYTDVLARATFAAGAFIMVLSLVWGGILLLKQYGSLKEQVGKTE